MGITAGGLAEIEKKKKTVDQTILDPNIFIKEFPLDPWTPYLVTNRFVQQGINRILGYNPTEKKWVRLQVNDEGKLEVATITTVQNKFYNGTDWENLPGLAGVGPYSVLRDREFEDVTLASAESLNALGTFVSAEVDVSGYARKTVLVSTTQNCTVYYQISHDAVTWFDPKTQADGDIAFNCNNEAIAIAINDCAHYIRVVVYNASASAATITVVLEGQV
jgi:hypothetical protein